MEIEIILPAQADERDPLSFGLVSLTEAIADMDEEVVAHGVLGGHFGYGARWENDVFVMQPFYWGDCDCGADERSETWHAAHPHAGDCFQVELHRRFAAYDETSGYNAIDQARLGGDTMEETTEETPFGTINIRNRTAIGDEMHKRWRVAHDAKIKAHDKITAALYKEYKLPKPPYQWHCTCGVDELAKTYFKDEGHYQTCALELPNFRHKSSGFEVRWYKWIGRDNQTNRPASRKELQRIFSECAASIVPQTGRMELREGSNTGSFPNNNVSATPAGKGETSHPDSAEGGDG